MLVEVSGIDGSGKSSVLQAVKGRLIRAGMKVSYRNFKSRSWLHLYNVAEATGVDFWDFAGVDAPHFLAASDLFFEHSVIFGSAASRQHIFLVDRYLLSLISEAILTGMTKLEGLEILIDFCHSPDLSFHLNVTPNVAFSRAMARTSSDLRVHQEGLKRLQNQHDAYLQAVDMVNYDCVHISNEGQDELENCTCRIVQDIIARFEDQDSDVS